MIYSKNQVFKEKFFRVDYNQNYYEYILLRSCRMSGFEEICKKDKKIIDKEEVQRIEKSRIKSKIKEYALCNDFEYFYTQTLNSNYDRYDLEEFKKIIQKKFKAYKRKNTNFKYLLIFEKHKNGAYHLHGLLSGLGIDVYTNSNNYLSLAFFEDLGFNSLSKVKDNIKVAHYITKYITKDFEKTASGYSYFHSKNLKTAQKTELNFNEYKDDLNLVYQNEFIKKYKVEEKWKCLKK